MQRTMMSKIRAIILTAVAYTPLNMDKETGIRKKHEFTMDVLNNDLFPLLKKLVNRNYIC